MEHRIHTSEEEGKRGILGTRRDLERRPIDLHILEEKIGMVRPSNPSDKDALAKTRDVQASLRAGIARLREQAPLGTVSFEKFAEMTNNLEASAEEKEWLLRHAIGRAVRPWIQEVRPHVDLNADDGLRKKINSQIRVLAGEYLQKERRGEAHPVQPAQVRHVRRNERHETTWAQRLHKEYERQYRISPIEQMRRKLSELSEGIGRKVLGALASIDNGLSAFTGKFTRRREDELLYPTGNYDDA